MRSGTNTNTRWPKKNQIVEKNSFSSIPYGNNKSYENIRN